MQKKMKQEQNKTGKGRLQILGLVLIAVCLAAFGIVRSMTLPMPPAAPEQQRQNQQLQNQPASATVFAMDTVITLEANDGQSGEALQAAEDLITWLENIWSVTKEDSEIYQANHSQGNSVPVSPETEVLIADTLQMADETWGALNPALYPIIKAWGFTTREYRVPNESELRQLLEHVDYREIRLAQQTLTLPTGMEVDFGATAKGYVGDLLVQTMKDHGVTSGIINLGGNVALVGARPDGTPWRVGIRSPYGEGNMGVLEITDSHIITSGGYERYFIGDDGNTYWHILDPSDGAPAHSGIISATIVGDEGIRCDGLSTAVYVMGLEKAEEYWQENGGFDMILVTEDNEVFVTEGLADRFHLIEASQGIPVHIITK